MEDYIVEEKKKNFIDACSVGDLVTVQSLLKEKAFNINFVSNNGYTGLMYACWHGRLNVVRYLLTSEDLEQYSDINYFNEKNQCSALSVACYHGHLDIIRYLLTSPELSVHADIDLCQGVAIVESFEGDQLESFKYLLTSHELSQKANPEYALQAIYHLNGYYLSEQLNMIEFFLMDYGYRVKDDVLNNFKNNKQLKYLYDMYEKLLFKESVEQTLENKNIYKKQFKV